MRLINSLLPLPWSFYWEGTAFFSVLVEDISSSRRGKLFEEREGHTVLWRRDQESQVSHGIFVCNCGSKEHRSDIVAIISAQFPQELSAPWSLPVPRIHTIHHPGHTHPITWQIPCIGIGRIFMKKDSYHYNFLSIYEYQELHQAFYMNYFAYSCGGYCDVPSRCPSFRIEALIAPAARSVGDSPVVALGQSELPHQGHVPSPGTALI